MNDLNVTPVSPPMGEPSKGVQRVTEFYAEKGSTPPQRNVKVEEEGPSKPVSQPRPSDVVLRFNVDRETHEVTVYIMDRASRQIIRTIPPEELSKLKAGDLIELLA